MSQFKTLEWYAFMQRNKHEKGDVKKYIKFDDANGSLFLQLKHYRDDEWVNISYDTAKSEQSKGNEKRTKKSFLFKSPSKEEEEASAGNKRKRVDPAAARNDRPKGRTSSTSTTTSTNYTPAARPNFPDKLNINDDRNWRPTSDDNEMV